MSQTGLVIPTIKLAYHKSWPDLKSLSKTLPIRRKVLNVHVLFILTILIVDSMDLLHSIWRVPTLCLNQCLHSMRHTIDHVRKLQTQLFGTRSQLFP